MKRKKRKIFIWIIIVFSIILSLFLDDILIKDISLIRNNLLDNFFLVITYLSSEVIIFAVVTAFFLWQDKKRRWILPLWLTLGVSAIVSFVLKVTIQRLRPFQQGLVSLLPSLNEASYSTWSFSFPSSHAMLAFCAIPILSQQYPKLKKVWFGIAVLIAFSRLYFGLHFVSDVISGAAMGYLIGMMFVKLEKEHKFGEKIYERIIRK